MDTDDELDSFHSAENNVFATNEKTGETTEEDDDSDDLETQLAHALTFDDSVSDRYFLAQRSRAKAIKDTFTKHLKNVDLSEEQIKNIIDADFDRTRQQLKLTPYGPKDLLKIHHFLMKNMNVLLYGVGSKRDVLQAFALKYLKDQHHFIFIRGYSNDITYKQILMDLNRSVDNVEEPTLNESTLLNLLSEYYDKHLHLYIVINSIDLLFMKNVKIYNLFTQIMQNVANVRLIASIDHVNSARLWPIGESSYYRWIWYNVDTHIPYTTEKRASSGTSIMSASARMWKQNIDLSSMKHVYESLNANAQKIFILILKYFIDPKHSRESGYRFHDLYLHCREEFIVNSEVTLRAQLSEFCDHQLLKMKKAPDGSELVDSNVDHDTIKQFIDSLANAS